MPNAEVDVIAPATSVHGPQPCADDKRQRLFELMLVLLVSFGGAIGNAIFLYLHGPGGLQTTGNARWIMAIIQEATGLLLLRYVLSRRGLNFADLGLRWSFRSIGIGVMLALMAYISWGIGSGIVRFVNGHLLGFSSSGHSANELFAHASLAAIPFAFLNPFFEELIVRAYLMTEILDLTGSSLLAVIVSVALQTSYHLYYGWMRALSLSFFFLIFAVYYARKRQVLPIITAHAVNDLYGILRLM